MLHGDSPGAFTVSYSTAVYGPYVTSILLGQSSLLRITCSLLMHNSSMCTITGNVYDSLCGNREFGQDCGTGMRLTSQM